MGCSWRRFYVYFVILLIVSAIILMIYKLSRFKKDSQAVVLTDSGKITGFISERFGKKVKCYFGVPYADPPVGNLRFSKPHYITPWKGALRATKMKSSCWQSDHRINDKSIIKMIKSVPDWRQILDVRLNEDCLYLNIWVPDTNNFIYTRHHFDKPKTVLVWIHGGGFRSGSLHTYDGSIIASIADVIVVALNYRLGIFGFMAGDDIQGNFGLHDQVLALKWIKNNIKAFGGDPNNIVLFGESAGAISIGYHLISNDSNQLFKRAILQSGNPITPILLATPGQQKNATLKAAKMANCLAGHWTNRTLECLRNIPADKLYNISLQVYKKIPFAFLPVRDNLFFTDHPFELVKEKKFGQQKEILIGTNQVEGAHFARIGPLGKYWSSDHVPNITRSLLIKLLEEQGPKEIGKPIFNLIVDYSLEGIQNDKDPKEIWSRIIKVIGDFLFTCPDYLFINEFSSLKDHSVYYYHFKPKPSFSPWSPRWAHGAVHGDEIPFVFGYPLLARKFYTRKEADLSRKIIKYWTEFAKTGKPVCCSLWKEYTKDKPMFMELDLKVNRRKQGFPGSRCDQFYEQLYIGTRDFVRGNHLIT